MEYDHYTFQETSLDINSSNMPSNSPYNTTSTPDRRSIIPRAFPLDIDMTSLEIPQSWPKDNNLALIDDSQPPDFSHYYYQHGSWPGALSTFSHHDVGSVPLNYDTYPPVRPSTAIEHVNILPGIQINHTPMMNQPQIDDTLANSQFFLEIDVNTYSAFKSDCNSTPELQWIPKQLSSSPRSLTKPPDATSPRPYCFNSSARVRKPSPRHRQALLRGRVRHRQGPDSAENSGGEQRVFTCSFASYGCQSTFSSKNEWKRHVSSKHLQLGFYRCDVGKCSEYTMQNNTSIHSSTSPVSYPKSHPASLGKPNDFNRKDLFTQHQRRMHVPWLQPGACRVPTDADYSNFEESLEEVRQRCFHELRQVPQESNCVFCSASFSGNGSWDARMEHIGRHVERDDPDTLHEKAEDMALRDWGLQEGILALKDGECRLVNLRKG